MLHKASSFDRFGSDSPASPIILSVPHAGRDYPEKMLAALRLPLSSLTVLEDRHVDRLAHAARGRETLFVQRAARAWIDLNRDERERDPKLDDGADARATAVLSHKLRSGLGLVPRRVAQGGDIWKRRLSAVEVDARIVTEHRPYHAAIAAALVAARAHFGIAVLLDIHSMPPLGDPRQSPRIVFGDRFGRTAATRLVSRLEAVAEAHGHTTALNTPYAGGYILDRHARPDAGIHAIQIEFDRSLYLDRRLDRPGLGLEATADMLRAMIDAVADEALATPRAIAAE
jgi:N-formylglutamate amidohydrolase